MKLCKARKGYSKGKKEKRKKEKGKGWGHKKREHNQR